MKPFALAQFNECFLPILDGVSFTVRNYAYWLNQKIAPTCVVTTSFPKYIDNEEFPVIRYSSAPLPFRTPYRIGLPILSQSLTSQLQRYPLVLVHAHSPFTAGYLALKIGRMKHIPVVATFHSKYRSDFERWIPNKSLVKYFIDQIVRFYDSVDEVWIPQKSVESTLREYGYKGRVVVMENGVDFVPFADAAAYREESRKILGVSPGSNILLYVGQHIWEKNLKLLIQALRYIQGTQFTMYFIGDGYAKREMGRLSAEFGIAQNVKFLTPIYQRDRLMRWYAAADLFLFPSRYDNAPLVLREAAAVQTPGLLVEGSTSSEIIYNNFNGFIASNNPKAYGQKIEFLLNHKEKLRKAGRIASRTICRSWESIVCEVAERYQFLLNRANKSNTVLSVKTQAS